jgi:uncharacterized membrane protein YhaH (DUF805 family)
MIINNPTTFRRTVRGASMIAAPLILVIAEVLHAHLEEDPSAYLSAIAENTGRWYAAHVLVLVSLVLALPAFLGIRHLVESRRPALGSLASIAFVPGLIALAALVGMELVAWQMAQPGVDRAQMITLWKNTSQSAGIVPIIFVALLFSLAWLLAGIGLYVSRLCPRWAAALIALMQLVGFVSELSGGPKWVAVAAQVGFAIGLIPIGVRMLRQSDESWEAHSAAPLPTPVG